MDNSTFVQKLCNIDSSYNLSDVAFWYKGNENEITQINYFLLIFVISNNLVRGNGLQITARSVFCVCVLIKYLTY